VSTHVAPVGQGRRGAARPASDVGRRDHRVLPERTRHTRSRASSSRRHSAQRVRGRLWLDGSSGRRVPSEGRDAREPPPRFRPRRRRAAPDPRAPSSRTSSCRARGRLPSLRRHAAVASTCSPATMRRRWPWATCPGAAEPLRKLAGMALCGGSAPAGDRPEAELRNQFDTAPRGHARRGAATRASTTSRSVADMTPARAGAPRVDGSLRPRVDRLERHIARPRSGAPWRAGSCDGRTPR
jgi:hypothetical protein